MLSARKSPAYFACAGAGDWGRVEMYAPAQVAATELRYEQRSAPREETRKMLRDEGLVAANAPEQVKRRKRRIAASAVVPPEIANVIAYPSPQADALLERVIDSDDLLNINYLALALAAARGVGRVRIRKANGRSAGAGTGFLVSPRLLLTNNHVLRDESAAVASLVDFGYEDGLDGQPLVPVTFALEPATFFLTDPQLDFTIVAVAPRSQAGDDLAGFGWCQLIETQGKLLKGEKVNIIQHPNGDRKRIALRQNEVVDLLDLFIHYKTDTSPGSSGAPVFNDQWEVVALHHSGVPEKDGQGRILRRDGKLWTNDMDDDEINWKANEGARVSQIVAAIREGALGPRADSALRDELLSGVRPVIDESHLKLATRSPVSVATLAPSSVTPRSPVSDSWTVDVRVTISPGAHGAPNVAVSRAAPAATTNASGTTPIDVIGVAAPDAADLQAALTEARAARSRPYYDAADDRAAAATYYADFQTSNDRAENFRRLSDLARDSHAKELRYRPLVHLYPWIDLQPNRKLQSIYSTRMFEPEEIIREDFEIERVVMERAAAIAGREGLSPEAAEALLEAVSPYNCEHVVPQSWFAKREPMRGDLHHLFTCEWGCNSFRGNTPYFDFPDFNEALRDQCGRRELEKFEPSGGRGVVARATLYFLIRYPGEIGDEERELQGKRLATLVDWHKRDPVNDYERHRNWTIAKAQGNRNPFIDRPELVEKVDFAQGFA
jgi:endonuclease G, mitochondrial